MNAIVTGATKGIGLAIIQTFAQQGINLIICSRNKEDLEQIKAKILLEYPSISIFCKVTDVSKKEQIQEFAAFALSKFDKIDILVNNAGVFFPGETHTEEEGKLEAMIETNLYSAYYLTNDILPSMIKEKNGHIVNMCSIASKIAYPNGGSYSISKFALLGYTKVLREELKDKGIKVSAILPGATWSNSWAGVDLPHSRLMEAMDIAKVVYNCIELGPSAVTEEVVIRPQLGDL